MNDPHHIFDRDLLRRRRQRAAPRMAAHAFLLDRFHDDVEERLSLISRTFSSALVVGAHGGSIGALLRRRGIASVVEMDQVPGLLPTACAMPVLADEEALPFADESFDLIVAPLTLHFVNDLPGALLQIRRCLKPDGLFIGGLFGGATLQELRRAWLEAESEISGGASPRVAPFADVRDLGGLLQRARFALPVVDADVMRVRYASALDLMHELRAMGASNILDDRRRTPVSRALLMRVSEIYADRFADPDGRVPATFEMLVMTAWAPHESQQKPLQPGSAKARLADALGTTERKLPRSTGDREG
jgi:SAM-dependent methyltransferase